MATDSSTLQTLADAVVDLVQRQARGIDAEVEANVRVSRTRHGLTRFAESFIHQHVGEDTSAVHLTLAVDARTASATTNRLDHASLDDLVARTLASAARQPVDPVWPGATPPSPPGGSGRLDEATAAAEPGERAEQVRRFVDTGGGELRAAGYLDTEVDWTAFASTAGQRAVGATSRATIDGIHQTPSSAGSGHQTSVRLADLDAEVVGQRAADLARRSADARDLDPGSFEVVLGPEAVATLLTFLGFYGFNAKAHLEGASFAELGAQQFDPAITLLDDPDDPRAVGLPFDAEGTPRTRATLVDRGVVRALAHDRRTAKRAGAVSTGGAISGGESFGAFPTNLRLPGGDTPASDLVAEVERGLLVTQFNYVRVLEPKTLLSTGLTRNGTFLIEDGRIVAPIANLRFTDSFLHALSPGQVLGVGDDDRYADGEFGPGMVICPSLRLRSFAFTGGARG